MMWQKRFEKKALCAVAFCTLGGLLAACGSDGCVETREAYCVAEFESTSGAALSQVYVWGIGQQRSRAIRIDSVFAYHPETATMDTTVTMAEVFVDSLMASAFGPETLELMLRPDTTETRLRMQFTARTDDDNAQYEDTLTLRYTPQPYFIDMECGCTVRFLLHELLSTHHFIQSASITHDEITNAERVNLHIEY